LACSREEALAYFADLAKETGMISEERPGETYTFIHLTFCEFFAAREAVIGQTNGWNSLVNGHATFAGSPERQSASRLLEVIPFAAGLLTRSLRPRALEDVEKLGDSGLLARTFLETKAYEHPTWARFVSARVTSMLGSRAADWDEQWLADLYLFNVVVRDANECAKHGPIAGGTVELDRLFERLASSQELGLSKLLAAYATQDAPAAFRFAEVCRVDMAMQFPEIVVTSCDQAPFFGLVLDGARRASQSGAVWAALLAESALRLRVVAVWLQKLEVVSSWKAVADALPARLRWHQTGIVARSTYTDCIAYALRCPDGVMEGLPLLSRLRNVPPPGAFTPTLWIIGGSLLLLLVGFWSVGARWSVSAWLTASSDRPGFLARAAEAMIVVGIPYVWLFGVNYRVRSMRRVFGILLNTRVWLAREAQIAPSRRSVSVTPRELGIARWFAPGKLKAAAAEFLEIRARGM
jgi:hypothetical protein